jgi:hypothetical protein
MRVARRYRPESEFVVLVNDKVFVGLIGGKPFFSEDWSKAKKFDDERKMKFFTDNFKEPIKLLV